MCHISLYAIFLETISKMKTKVFVYNNQEYTILICQKDHEKSELVKTSEPTDIWFHVAESSSCHLLLKTTCAKISDIPCQVLTRCACLCKTYSKSSNIARCAIIYTQAKHVETISMHIKVNIPYNFIKTIIL